MPISQRPAMLRNIYILERIFIELLPVKIIVYWSLEYMEHDPRAYDMMGLLHDLATCI